MSLASLAASGKLSGSSAIVELLIPTISFLPVASEDRTTMKFRPAIRRWHDIWYDHRIGVIPNGPDGTRTFRDRLEVGAGVHRRVECLDDTRRVPVGPVHPPFRRLRRGTGEAVGPVSQP